jgi:hypothetical protein
MVERFRFVNIQPLQNRPSAWPTLSASHNHYAASFLCSIIALQAEAALLQREV